MWSHREELHNRLVTLTQDSFVQKPEQSNITPKTGGREIVLDEGTLLCQVQFTHIPPLHGVDAAELAFRSMLEDPVVILNQIPHMCLVLSEHVRVIIKSPCA